MVGINAHIEEVELTMRTGLKRIVYLEHGEVMNGVKAHQVLHVVLPTDEEYIIDTSAAQFEIMSPVAPFAEYQGKYVARIKADDRPHGNLKEAFAQRLRLSANPDEMDRVYIVHRELAKHMDCEVEKWEEVSGHTIAQSLQMPDPEFKVTKQKFVDIIKAATNRFVIDEAKEIKNSFGIVAKARMSGLTRADLEDAELKRMYPGCNITRYFWIKRKHSEEVDPAASSEVGRVGSVRKNRHMVTRRSYAIQCSSARAQVRRVVIRDCRALVADLCRTIAAEKQEKVSSMQ